MALFLDGLKERARKEKNRILFPEPEDKRILAACRILKDEGLAEPLLIGDPEKVKVTAEKEGINLMDISFFNPAADSGGSSHLGKELYKIRRHKGISPEKADNLILDPMYFATMLLYSGEADGVVAGASHPTAWTFKPLLQILPKEPGINYVSSYFVMSVPNSIYGHKGVFIYADCGLITNPDAEQLAEIAIASADTAQNLFEIEPKVALLSFSTKGSGYDPLIVKVVEAARIANKKRPDLAIEGELQVDAAMVPEVAVKKMAASPVAGKANVLIFPDLNSGNIAYKLTQRLANAEAWGPLVQGLSKAASDLSRGCSVGDVIAVSTIVAVQAQRLKRRG